MADLHAIPRDVAERIRLIGLDVDGVLTDGGIYLAAGTDGERIEAKRFHIMDGLGIRLLRDSGIEVAIVTGRVSDAVRLRAEELGISECHQDASAAKLPIVEALLRRRGLSWAEIAFMGDDLPDLPVLRRAGLPVAVANAAPEVHAAAAWVARRSGGQGAVRELAEALLHARGVWTDAVARYLDARSGR